MALRYFCAQLSKIVIRIKYSTSSGYLPKMVRLTSLRTEI